ncbi:adenylate kinase [bacterium E08(2017)]|nr:adenylate kinase [bacterium E08(2017)]
MKVIILMGAPGSGKGTTAERISEANYQHVSTGDMLRAAVKAESELGQEADGYMKRGELVPDELIIRLIEELLDKGTDESAYLFDGFPRTEVQADLLNEALAKRDSAVGQVMFLDVPRDVLITRLTGRRICRQCGVSFHVVNIPPKVEGVCDACGGELYQRADDSEETIKNRLDVYNEQTKSLISYYEERGLLKRLDGDQGADNLAQEVLSLIQ